MDMKPGRTAAVVGTVAAVVGFGIIFFNWNRPDYQNGFFIGALLVLGGLLLRIEAAVAGVANRLPADD